MAIHDVVRPPLLGSGDERAATEHRSHVSLPYLVTEAERSSHATTPAAAQAPGAVRWVVVPTARPGGRWLAIRQTSQFAQRKLPTVMQAEPDGEVGVCDPKVTPFVNGGPETLDGPAAKHLVSAAGSQRR